MRERGAASLAMQAVLRAQNGLVRRQTVRVRVNGCAAGKAKTALMRRERAA
jgi:hypothetical protein